MRKSGHVIKRLAVSRTACAAIRRNALAQARAQAAPAPAWRKWLGLEKNLKEGVDGGPHGRLLIPLAPDDDGVGDVLTKALAAVGRDAVAEPGLSEDAVLVELSVLAVLPRAAAQPPHLDVLPRDGLAMATLFIPLQDVSEKNGATVLYPAPPSSVAVRRDWARLHKDDDNRIYAPDGSDDSDAATIQAEAAGLLPPVASPWAKFSPSELGLGEPLTLEMRAGDVALMDYRCFHRGGANVSDEVRCVMYATFSSEGDHHSYSLEASKQTRRLGEFLSAAEDVEVEDVAAAKQTSSARAAGEKRRRRDAQPTTTSQYYGVRRTPNSKKWEARFVDADGRMRYVGRFLDEAAAARARDDAVEKAGLGRKLNADASGVLVPKPRTASRYRGITWHPNDKRWRARYYDADGKLVYVGNFVDEAAAALAYNAAIKEAGLKRRANPVDSDGRPVPKKRPDRRYRLRARR